MNESLLDFLLSANIHKIIALVPFHPQFPIDTARRAALLVCFFTIFTMGRVLLSIFSCLLVLSVDVLCFCCKLFLPQELIMMLIQVMDQFPMESTSFVAQLLPCPCRYR